MKINFSRLTASDYSCIAYVALFAIVFISVVILIVVDRLEQSKTGQGINMANIAMLKKGMTEPEVLQLLGCKRGWYAGPKHEFYGSFMHGNFGDTWMNSANGISLAIKFDNTVPPRVDGIYVLQTQPNLSPKPEGPPPLPELPFRVH